MPDAPTHVFIGIDPGAKGGMVAIQGGSILIKTKLEGMNHYAIRDWLEVIQRVAKDKAWKIVACIEKVGGFIGGEDEAGHRSNKASAHTMFTLGESYGALDMALVCCRISRKQVLPQEWQKRYGMKKEKGESQTKWKGRLRAKAQLLYPQSELTLAVADAALIAHHCSRLSWGV